MNIILLLFGIGFLLIACIFYFKLRKITRNGIPLIITGAVLQWKHIEL